MTRCFFIPFKTLLCLFFPLHHNFCIFQALIFLIEIRKRVKQTDSSRQEVNNNSNVNLDDEGKQRSLWAVEWTEKHHIFTFKRLKYKWWHMSWQSIFIDLLSNGPTIYTYEKIFQRIRRCLWLQCICLPCRMAPWVVVPESNGLQVSQGEGSSYQEHVHSTSLKHLLLWIRHMMRFAVSVCTHQGHYHLEEFSPRSWNGTFVQYLWGKR